MGCRHYRRDAPKLSCDAFPGVIPDPIIYSAVDHRWPYAGDNGIQFDPKDEDAAAYADEIFGPRGRR